MKISQLLPSVRIEVEKPFQEKLEKARKLVKLFVNKNACVSCSFGKDSTVVLWLCLQENPKIPVIWNNTGVEYLETVEFARKLADEWDLNLIETKPTKTFWQVMNEILDEGEHLDDGRKHSNQCCYALKHAPFRKIVRDYGFTHTFTGLTVMESRHRMLTACQKGQTYYTKRDNVWRIHPIAFWTPEEVWQFIRDNNIPVNPAYAKYKLDRIGCVPCTSHKNWRDQLAKVNPRMYKFIQERFFGQKLLEVKA